MSDKKLKFITKDGYPFVITIFIVIGIIFFYSYVLAPNWAHTSEGKALIETTSQFYPGLKILKNEWPGYTPQIGVLFSIMWLGMPLHLTLGFVSTLLYPKDIQYKYIINAPWKRIVLYLLLISFATTAQYFFPHVKPAGTPGISLNQASDSIAELALSWILICTTIFGFGQCISAALIKVFSQIKEH